MYLEHLEETKPLLESLMQQHRWKEISKILGDWPEPEVADLLLQVDKKERVLLYRCLPRGRAAEMFAHLDYEHQESLLKELADQDTRLLLADLSPDDRTALLEELPAQVTQAMFRLLSPEDLREARRLLGYPEESIGRLMTPDYLAVQSDWTVGEAIEHMRKAGRDRETFNMVYVVDESGKLLDALRIRRFILSDPSVQVESLMDRRFVSLSAFDDREVAVDTIKRYDLNALPVVDSEGVLVGIVTVDDVFDVAEEEATEDIQKGAAVAPLDMPYSLATPGFLFQRRIGWLTILIFVNLISGFVIAAYEEYLEAFLILAFFMPLLIATGGNTGAQSATLMVRAFATGDLKPSMAWRAFFKEIAVGLLLAVCMGILTYALGLWRGKGDMDVALVVALSMAMIVLVANLIGVLLPFVLMRFKMDPAVASSPLITSMMDAIGLLLYFATAAYILDLGLPGS